MSSIQRRLPDSTDGRKTALDKAKNKNDNLPLGTVILSAATVTRLNAQQPLFQTAVNELMTATANSTNATALKSAAQGVAEMLSSHYYQALNNAIARGVYPSSVRAFYGLDVNSGAVPEMTTEDLVKQWGERVSSGETALVAAGHAAIPFPSEPQVRAKVIDYKTKLTTQSSMMDITDLKQEAITALNDQADKVIKKVWDEVETYHNEEPLPSMRANAVQWGVVYKTLGNPTQITFKAVRSDDGAAIQDVEFKIKSTGNIYISDDADSVTFETRLVGDEIIRATHPLYNPLEQPITIVEGQPMTVTFTLVPVV